MATIQPTVIQPTPRTQLHTQDRITSDGDFISSASPAAQHAGQWQAAFTGVPDTAPQVAPISEAHLTALAEFLLCNRRVTVLTGAGASTESNIPDYRGPRGAYSTGEAGECTPHPPPPTPHPCARLGAPVPQRPSTSAITPTTLSKGRPGRCTHNDPPMGTCGW